MKNKEQRFSDLIREFDLPEDICKGGYHIEIFNGTVVVDGCRNVSEYGDGSIKLNTGGCQVGVFGDNLTIRSFVCSQITITGRIISVELE